MKFRELDKGAVFRFMGKEDFYCWTGYSLLNLSKGLLFPAGPDFNRSGELDIKIINFPFDDNREMDKQLALAILEEDESALSPLLDYLIEQGVVDKLVEKELALLKKASEFTSELASAQANELDDLRRELADAKSNIYYLEQTIRKMKEENKGRW